MFLIFTFATESDRDKFEWIYSKYKNLMLHKAYGILHDYMLAEDAVSEAFIRVYNNLHKIDDPESNRCIAFVMTIVRNAALTMLSKETKNATELIDETQEDEFNLEQHILSELSKESIYQMLDEVGEDLRNVFVLKFAYDLSHKEIGKALGISENNVTVRLHRARKKLSAILAKGGYACEQE